MASKKLLLVIVLTVLVFVGRLSYGDLGEIGSQLAHFPITHLMAAVALLSRVPRNRTVSPISSEQDRSVLQAPS